MPNVAILTNDLQYEFTHKISTDPEKLSRLLKEFNVFLDGIRAAGQLVVHLQLIHDPNDPQVQSRYRGRAIPAIAGTPGNRLIEDVVRPSDLVVVKGRDSGFYETKLDETLRQRGVKTVVVTGLQTHVCVQTTAADAFFRGYKVWVPEDGVFSPKPEDTQRALEWLAGYCATVAPSSEILKRLKEHSDLPGRGEEVVA
ncbi:cysteine hydrolase [Caballeronia novacaledonica]|uniref:cysteine hydrolase family protein n=1 Tax=Caballeronia novacaledonica TaxID=1544861 RepID=UPI001EE1918D|nr:isochorismatase family cysteine hydrolase [Caballeronia novacaledonica]GJH13231.1 cysteine hydrolase [Caballeronia novacaledonica]